MGSAKNCLRSSDIEGLAAVYRPTLLVKAFLTAFDGRKTVAGLAAEFYCSSQPGAEMAAGPPLCSWLRRFLASRAIGSATFVLLSTPLPAAQLNDDSEAWHCALPLSARKDGQYST